MKYDELPIFRPCGPLTREALVEEICAIIETVEHIRVYNAHAPDEELDDLIDRLLCAVADRLRRLIGEDQ